MGIYMSLFISKSVTKQEWETVYEETLRLLKYFPFAERKEIRIQDMDTFCLIRTEEREWRRDRWSDKTHLGWMTEGDYETLKTAEAFYLPRNLNENEIEKNEVEENEIEEVWDALWGVFPACLDYDRHDPRFSRTYPLWGGKTQGEPFHMYLLAVAAYVEARLGTKAFTYGDITQAQFEKAVEMVNKYLAEPIDIPDSCCKERLWKRVRELPVSPEEQLTAFVEFYLGTKDAAFGEYIRQKFEEAEIDAYWKKEFDAVGTGTIGFDRTLHKYITWGFDAEKLNYNIEVEDKKENEYTGLLQKILEKNRKAAAKEQEMYDIAEYEELIYYEEGDVIHPDIQETLVNCRRLMDEIAMEEETLGFLEKEAEECYELLQEWNRYILIRDKDWERIFHNIKEARENFVRYYALLSIDMRTQNIIDLCKALMLNDALYKYSGSLERARKDESYKKTMD